MQTHATHACDQANEQMNSVGSFFHVCTPRAAYEYEPVHHSSLDLSLDSPLTLRSTLHYTSRTGTRLVTGSLISTAGLGHLFLCSQPCLARLWAAWYVHRVFWEQGEGERHHRTHNAQRNTHNAQRTTLPIPNPAHHGPPLAITAHHPSSATTLQAFGMLVLDIRRYLVIVTVEPLAVGSQLILAIMVG
jgi:hypothetical protein